MLEFIWDKKVQRYRYKDSGKFVGEAAVRNLTQMALKQSQEDITSLAWGLIEQRLTLDEWESQTAKALKRLHTYQYLLGIGGQKQMKNIDYGILGGEIKNEYKYLRRFSQDLLEGKVTEGQFFTRLGMYIEASTGSYEKGRLKSHIRAGYKWEKRVRTKQESCAPCIGFAAMGWQRIGTLPNPTEQCTCRSNCGCFKRFSKSVERPKDSFSDMRFGFINSFYTHFQRGKKL